MPAAKTSFGSLRSVEFRPRRRPASTARRPCSGGWRKRKVGGWHDDPCRGSLGLLPSGPDPVGEWLVHHQPPTLHIVNCEAKSKEGATQKASAGRKKLVNVGLWNNSNSINGFMPTLFLSPSSACASF